MAAPGLVTASAPANAVVEVQPGMQVQPVVLVDSGGNYAGWQDDPAVYGLAFWTLPLFTAGQTNGPGAQTLVMILARAITSGPVGHLGCWVDSAGVTAGAGVNGLALYTEAGALLGHTGDMTAQFEGTGYVEGVIAVPAQVTAGVNYYLAFLHDFTGTSPALVAGPGLSGYPAIRSHYPSVVAFGQASFPVSVTPSGMTAGAVPLFLTAGT